MSETRRHVPPLVEPAQLVAVVTTSWGQPRLGPRLSLPVGS